MVDDEIRTYGFYKNEYLLAAQPEIAKAKAFQNVRRALEENSAIQVQDPSTVTLDVDGVEQILSFWKLLKAEGFVFFEAGNDAENQS